MRAATVLGAVVLVAVAAAPTGAVAQSRDEITVDGTAVVITVDDFDTPPVPVDLTQGTLPSSVTSTEVAIEVDGELLPVSDAQGDGLTSGQDVVVTLDAPTGMSTDDAVAAAARGAASVELVGVAPAVDGDPGSSATDATLLAADPAGAHTITVLPVYWTSPDVGVAELEVMAAESAAYWSETSGGTMTFETPVVEDWVEVSPPASCSISGGAVTGLYTDALAAHGYPGDLPSTSNHLVVYFPDFATCGWVGLASLDDGRIWVNGLPDAEVLAHEMGHNLGLGHANTARCSDSAGTPVPFSDTCVAYEYGDWADLMGNVWYLPPGNLNSALADELEMVEAVTAPSGSVLETVIAPLGDFSAQRAVRIPLNASAAFYVSYRPYAGRDTRQPTWAGSRCTSARTPRMARRSRTC